MARVIVVCGVMLSLTVTLAARTVHLPQGNATSVQSDAQNSKIQHRNTDAVRWTTAIPAFVHHWSATPCHEVVVHDEPLRSIVVDAGLYTRPPPRS